jgi:hypothetical protein
MSEEHGQAQAIVYYKDGKEVERIDSESYRELDASTKRFVKLFQAFLERKDKLFVPSLERGGWYREVGVIDKKEVKEHGVSYRTLDGAVWDIIYENIDFQEILSKGKDLSTVFIRKIEVFDFPRPAPSA